MHHFKPRIVTSLIACAFAVGMSSPLVANAGVINEAPSSLVSYWDFDSTSGGSGGDPLTSPDVAHANGFGAVDDTAVFQGGSTATTGLIGSGAALIEQEGVEVFDPVSSPGDVDFSFSGGITLETLFATTNLGNNIQNVFRIESGADRVLLSFQDAGNINPASGDEGLPGIALGLNIGGSYSEFDVELDGKDGRPTLADLNDGGTHHLVATYDDDTDTRAIYIDGALIGSETKSGVIANGTDVSGRLGTNQSASTRFFDGTLDEFAIHKDALSAQAVSDHFNTVQAGDAYFVPEPASAALLALGGAVMFVPRRKRRG